jgi:hypothetical protein
MVSTWKTADEDKGRIMPRTMGTIFGLALAAGSIAFNAIHYPIALPAGGPAAGRLLGDSSLPPPSAKTAGPAAAESRRPSPLPANAGVQPVADLANPGPDSAPASRADRQRDNTADKPARMPAAFTAAKPSPPADSTAVGQAAPADGSPGAPALEKPLVPIVRPSTPAAPAEATPTLLRLPPVDPSPPAPSAAPPSDGAIPVYPSTGK